MSHRSGGALRVALAGLAVAAALTFAGCASDGSRSSSTSTVAERAPQGFGTVTLVVTSPDGTVSELCVWLADTPALRDRGLMAVTDVHLGGAAGMVFVFPGDTTTGFWMKDTLLPLSIAWFAADGSFVSGADMDPCPAAVDRCPISTAADRYRYAVKVPQGGLADLALVEGSSVSLGSSCTPGAGTA